MQSTRQAATQAIRRRLRARLDFHDGPGAAAAAASSRMAGVRECHVNARHPSRRKRVQPDQRRGDHRRAPSSSECDEARCGGRRTPRAPPPLRGSTSSSFSPAAASTAAAFTAANPASTTAPSPHARAAFRAFLRSRNAPYAQPGDAATSPTEGIRGRATATRALASSEALAMNTAAAAAAASPSLSVSQPFTGPASVPRFSEEVHAAPSSSPRHSRTDASSMKTRDGGQCVAATPVLQEWSLAPPDAVGWEGARGQSQTREDGALRDTRRVLRARDRHTPSTTHGGDTPPTHRGGPLESTRDTAEHATQMGDEGEALPQDARQPPPDDIPNQLRQHRRHAVALARRELAARVGRRHRDRYVEAAVHAYRILLQVEQRLVRWAVARQRGSHARTGATASSRHGAAEAVRADAREHVGEPRKAATSTPAVSAAAAGHREEADIDAVEAHFFEYAGQIRRTLHELTPRHFDAVHDHRLRSRTSATAEPLPLLLLSLLWRLLHIQRLFHSIGRSAGLPRGAVGVYVQSSNCAYGMREVLRVLAAELARSTMRSSAGAAGCAGASGGAATSRPFSNAELFQLFYAVLCIPSEEAPGVPLLYPAAAEHAGTDGAAAAHQLDAFHHDCVDTSGDVGRMPLDEWCVRWWAHQYANAAREAEQQRTDTSASAGRAPSPPLPLGASLDVLRACLYSTTSGAAAALVTTGGISSARAAPPGHRDGRQRAAAHTRLVTPLTFFETPPEGGGVGGRRDSRDASRRAQTAATASATTAAGTSNAPELRVLDRRFHPRLPGALGGGGKASLRIPFHLGQRYVSSLLQYLLSRAARRAAVPDERAEVHKAASSSSSDASSASAAASSVDAAAALQRLLDGDGTRDAVRDVALLCTAILFFEVYTPSTAAFMAHAAPLCHAQVELLSGHELSCVLLAYASLQRWERGGGDAAVDGEAGHRPGTGETANMAASRRRGPLRDATVEVQSESSAATARAAAAAAATAEAAPHGRRTDSQWTSANADGTTRHARSATEGGTWHLFFITLGTRAGQLCDTLSEEDVTRVLRAMKLTGLEHADLRRAMESSLRLRNLGRRVLYEA